MSGGPGPAERLALAFGIGLLAGVERGWRDRDLAEGERTAGVRTFTLAGLLGGLSALLAGPLGGAAFVALALPFAGAVIWFKARETAEEGRHSVTTVVAALAVFALGAYAVVGDWRLAAGAGVVLTSVLAAKAGLHAGLRRLTWPELRSALVLLAMTFVVLPLLPDRGFGPQGLFNPHEVWLLTIGLAGVSFLAYAATKALGPVRGLLAATLAGAMVSSTAVTLELGRRSRDEGVCRTVALAWLASAVMAIRIAIIAAALSSAMALTLARPLIAFTAVSLSLGALGLRKPRLAPAPATDDAANVAQAEAPPVAMVRSPLDLRQVAKLALVLAAVTAAARWLSVALGDRGVMTVAAVAGLADVDAVTLAVGRMAQSGLDPAFAGRAILLACAVGSGSKVVLGGLAGGWRFGWRFAGGTALALAAGLAAWAAGA